MSIPLSTFPLLSMLIHASTLPQYLVLFAFGVVTFAVVCLVHFLFNSCLGQDWVVSQSAAATDKERYVLFDNMFSKPDFPLPPRLSFAPRSLTATASSPICRPSSLRRQNSLFVELIKAKNMKPPPFRRQNAFLLEKGESLSLDTVPPPPAIVEHYDHDEQGGFLRPMRMADYKHALATEAAAEWSKMKAEWRNKQAIWQKTTIDNMKYPRRVRV